MMKKILCAVLSVLAVVCFAFGITATATSIKAKAEETVTITMKTGASVRVGGDNSDINGIRFSATISKTDKEKLESNYASVVYGMLIAKFDDVQKTGELNAENVFGENAQYDWAVNGTYSGDGSKTRITNLTTSSDSLRKDGDNYVINGSVVKILDNNLTIQRIARAYAKCTNDSGAVTYIFSDYSEKNARSVVYVANAAIENGESRADWLMTNYLQKAVDIKTSAFENISVSSENVEALDKAYDELKGLADVLSESNYYACFNGKDISSYNAKLEEMYKVKDAKNFVKFTDELTKVLKNSANASEFSIKAVQSGNTLTSGARDTQYTNGMYFDVQTDNNNWVNVNTDIGRKCVITLPAINFKIWNTVSFKLYHGGGEMIIVSLDSDNGNYFKYAEKSECTLKYAYDGTKITVSVTDADGNAVKKAYYNGGSEDGGFANSEEAVTYTITDENVINGKAGITFYPYSRLYVTLQMSEITGTGIAKEVTLVDFTNGTSGDFGGCFGMTCERLNSDGSVAANCTINAASGHAEVQSQNGTTTGEKYKITLPRIDFTQYKACEVSFIVGNSNYGGHQVSLDGTNYNTHNNDSTFTYYYDGEKVSLTVQVGTAVYTKEITDADIICGKTGDAFYVINAGLYHTFNVYNFSAAVTPEYETKEDKTELSVGNYALYILDGDTYTLKGEVAWSGGFIHPQNGTDLNRYFKAVLPAINFANYKNKVVSYTLTANNWNTVSFDNTTYLGGTGESTINETVNYLYNGSFLKMYTTSGIVKIITDEDIINGKAGDAIYSRNFKQYAELYMTPFTTNEIARKTEFKSLFDFTEGTDGTAGGMFDMLCENTGKNNESKNIRKETAGEVYYSEGGIAIDSQTGTWVSCDYAPAFKITLPKIDFTKYYSVTYKVFTHTASGISPDSTKVAIWTDNNKDSSGYEATFTYTYDATVAKVTCQMSVNGVDGATREKTISDSDVINGTVADSFYVWGREVTTIHMSPISGEVDCVAETHDKFNTPEEPVSTVNLASSDYGLVVNKEGADEVRSYSYGLLNKIMDEAASAGKTIVNSSLTVNGGKNYVVFSKDADSLSGENISVDVSSFSKDTDYALKRVGNNFVIYGENAFGLLYGVQAFLSDNFNYKAFSYDVYSYTSKSDVSYDASYSETGTASFAYNISGTGEGMVWSPYFTNNGYEDIGYTALGLARGEVRDYALISSAGEGGGSFHNFTSIISQDEYGTAHPEWFKNDQLDLDCSTRSELVSAVVSKMKTQIAKESTRKYFSFSQNDYNDITKWADGTVNSLKQNSAEYILFMNDCAKQVDAWLKTEEPDREIELVMLAYQQTLDAPEYSSDYVLYQGDNASVSVMFCPLSANMYKKLDDSSNVIMDYSNHTTSTTVISALERWSKLASKIHFWLYGAIFDNYFCPLDSITNMQYNVQLCHQYSNGGILLYQGQRYNTANATELCTGTDWTTLKAYLVSCLAKDVNVDLSAETDAFMNAYYGAAASSMKELLALEQAWYPTAISRDSSLGFIKGGLNATSNSLAVHTNVWSTNKTKTMMLNWYGKITAAYNAIASLESTDSALYNTYHDRIERESLTIRYILLNVYSDKTVETSLSDLYARAKLLGVTKLSESADFPS